MLVLEALQGLVVGDDEGSGVAALQIATPRLERMDDGQRLALVGRVARLGREHLAVARLGREHLAGLECHRLQAVAVVLHVGGADGVVGRVDVDRER